MPVRHTVYALLLALACSQATTTPEKAATPSLQAPASMSAPTSTPVPPSSIVASAPASAPTSLTPTFTLVLERRESSKDSNLQQQKYLLLGDSLYKYTKTRGHGSKEEEKQQALLTAEQKTQLEGFLAILLQRNYDKTYSTTKNSGIAVEYVYSLKNQEYSIRIAGGESQQEDPQSTLIIFLRNFLDALLTQDPEDIKTTHKWFVDIIEHTLHPPKKKR